MYTVDGSLIGRFGLQTDELAGRTALVTGAARGLGEATARTLAALGAQIVIVDVHADAGSAVARNIREAGGEAAFLHCDLADVEAVQVLVPEAIAAFGSTCSSTTRCR